MAHKFEIYKDKKGEYRVRFKYNSEVMFASEGYSSKSSATNAIESYNKTGPGAPVEDNSRFLRRPAGGGQSAARWTYINPSMKPAPCRRARPAAS